MAQLLPRRVFVTVGSTRFDALVHAVLTPQVIDVLKAKKFQELVVQCGESDLSGKMKPLEDGEVRKGEVHGIMLEMYKFKPSLEEEYDRASLIIGHGGSGTILSALNRRKPMLVVPNPTLADDHQQELANIIAKNKQNVAQQEQQQQRAPQQPTDAPAGQRFASIMDETMGFAPR
ncbi:glycosyltransferase 28 [Coprinopsis sp. MPI-PUGE-AT-0042]|nr:glycosyltransferase 28 [Coprinopsis sp. MPI-PUGE-AT-0042]